MRDKTILIVNISLPIVFCGVVVMAVAAFVAYTEIHNRRQMSDLTRKNLIALTSDETIDGGSGLLWKKHWVTCPIAGQIIVTKGTERLSPQEFMCIAFPCWLNCRNQQPSTQWWNHMSGRNHIVMMGGISAKKMNVDSVLCYVS